MKTSFLVLSLFALTASFFLSGCGTTATSTTTTTTTDRTKSSMYAR